MREKMIRFMQGRSGGDIFSRFTSLISGFLFLASFLLRGELAWSLNFLAWLSLIYTFFRILSKNVYKRRAENERFMVMKSKLGFLFKEYYELWQQRKEYKFFKCPSCKTRLRVPRNKGKIKVVCRKCGTSFTAKS